MRAKYYVPKEARGKIMRELYQYWENTKQLQELNELDIIESTPIFDETGIKSKYKISNPTQQKAIKLADLSTRAIIEASRRVSYIEEVLKRLNQDEKKVTEYIFRDKLSQIQVQMRYNYQSSFYYNTRNKVVYLTAIEYGEI